VFGPTSVSNISVPLLRSGVPIGALAIGRFRAGEFTDTQIELVQTFAEQAVIAITGAETYHALQTRTSDLQESLEYQTATSDVLKVISRSTFDLQPVLDTVVETAARLCNADQAVINRREGGAWRLAANCGFPPEFEAWFRSRGLVSFDNPNTVAARTASECRPVHIHDVTTVPGYSDVSIRLGRQRTTLGVPLLREGEVIGTVVLARQRVEPFTERQIELVSTFADQAVIAIENTRLLTEQREALERQTATAEVLQVINASPGDLMPVFDAILNKAHALCGATMGNLTIYKDGYLQVLATHGHPEEIASLLRQPYRPNPATQRLIDGERFHQIQDLRAIEISDPDWSVRPLTRALIAQTDVRTVLLVPLRKDGALLGLITAHRPEVRLFSDKEIALLENFAAQAVIAMENARLLTEQREALEQQTATAEVLQVINSAPGDLSPVFDAMLEKTLILCASQFGALATYDGKTFHNVATRGVTLELAEYLRRPVHSSPGQALHRIVHGGEDVVHEADITETEGYRDGNPNRHAMADLGGVRTQLTVALRKDNTLRGVLAIYRREVRPFTDKQIALVQNFAAQAVIAIENARLINEQREALEQQTATAEVLQVINANPGNLQPVFDAMLEKAMRLCSAAFGGLYIADGQKLLIVASRGVPAAFAAYRAQNPPTSTAPGGRGARVFETKQSLHILDALTDPSYLNGDASERISVDLGGVRTLLLVPLLKEATVLGIIAIYRREVRAFSIKEIALVENFAAQAVIAMDNARLLHELRARTDELAQRQNELRITFENMGDGVALFDETRHLVASNRRFQEMLDVPDDVISARPAFADYIRYLADRGEYGPDPEAHVQRLLEFGTQSVAFERMRPNGRIIEIRGNPVPDGGFVVIYADITERKRNEEELRAARDAAQEASRTIEAAYRDLKAAQANLIQAEKMASLGQLTAGIAHEIKNPLNIVNNFAELSSDLLDELNDAVVGNRQAEIDELRATLQGNLAKISEHGRRADAIVRSMLEHSRGSSGERRVVDLNALIDEALNLAYHGARAQDQTFNITLERDFAEGIAPIELAPQDMTRVLLNLFSNGFYAAHRRQGMEPAKGFEPTLRVVTHDLGDAVEIRVRDNGIGIPEEIKDKLFQPFFTTKPTGEGTGLGLSISYDIITQQHGGSITVDSKVGEYSKFTIRLPRRP
jgi:GAF domain-containing protein/nitrogen-specific signal transduction histidine kinase